MIPLLFLDPTKVTYRNTVAVQERRSSHLEVDFAPIIADAPDFVHSVRATRDHIVANLWGAGDLGHGSPVRRLADSGTVIPERRSLLCKPAVDQSQVNLAGPIPSLLGAQRTVDNDVVFGEGFDACRNSSATSLAGDNEDQPGAGEGLRRVPGSHRGIVGRKVVEAPIG